jgi:hypothetical protein
VFERYISIDWAGAGTENQRGDLRVVQAFRRNGEATIVPPPWPGVVNWTRGECRRYLVQALREDQPRCLVAMDFGFGYPWRADASIFDGGGWRTMLRRLAKVYTDKETARSTAEAINSFERFGGRGPYRFDRDRSDFRFYLDHGISYYRLVEMAVPQAISQWYLGAGNAVGFGSITGMAALHRLIELRDEGEVEFRVWPQEGLVPDPDKHILAESYPAIYPELSDYGECTDEHCRDAWKALRWMTVQDERGSLERCFEIGPQPFGRVECVDFEEQIRFEG